MPRSSLAAAAALPLAAAYVAAAPYSLNLAPARAPLNKASVYYNDSMWSWGGSVIETPDDAQWRFHLFAAAFVDGCGLSAWKSNSQVIHGVANDPLGPFTFMDVAVSVWAHNPQVVRHTDGTYLLYSIGLLPEPTPRKCNGGGGDAADAADAADDDRAGGSFETMQLHYSDSVYGPWALAAANIFNGTNPAPWVNPDGSMVVGSHDSRFVVSTAPHWRGPYSAPVPLFSPPADGSGVVFEDPFLWFDAGAQVWRVLLHTYNKSDTSHQFYVGGAAASANASLFSTWTLQPYAQAVYTLDLPLSDGTSTTLHRRERPKILFNATTGLPAVLYNGVCPGSGNTDGCFTVAQAILPPAPAAASTSSL
jgi:hypothetical protein